MTTGQAPDPAGSISAVLDPKLRGPFALLVAVVVTVLLVLIGLRSAESFIDGRVDLKLAEQRKQTAEQEKRLEKMEEQFSTVRDALVEIRADLRILRASIPASEAVRAPASTEAHKR